VTEEDEVKAQAGEKRTVIYARVSSAENKRNLESQCERLRNFASAKGYKITKEVKEIGSGLNDKRPKLEKLLSKGDWDILLVEHKDRLARFGIHYLNLLLTKEGKRVEIINEGNDNKEDLMQDFVAIITLFCARLYGLRRSKRKTEKIIEELKAKDSCSGPIRSDTQSILAKRKRSLR
jgi:predicted site-specific integrase-resolvase